jgi:hypothetical protein
MGTGFDELGVFTCVLGFDVMPPPRGIAGVDGKTMSKGTVRGIVNRGLVRELHLMLATTEPDIMALAPSVYMHTICQVFSDACGSNTEERGTEFDFTEFIRSHTETLSS